MEKEIVGRAWIIRGFRPIYNSIREIGWGKNKGKVEIFYLKGKKLKKMLIHKDDIVERYDEKENEK